jgi:ABC-type phosphate transport system substrate-binding protein
MSQSHTTVFGDVPIRAILVLAANPTGTSHLRLDREVRDIDTELQQTQYRDRFNLTHRWAVRYRDVQGALQRARPQIVHFAGHGEGDQGLVFEDQTGNPTFIGANALANLFKLCNEHVECVVLNSCFSEIQARAISQHIPYVIGMRWPIGDTAAQEFAVSFYRALGQGYSIRSAYEWGCNAIEMANIPEEQTPVLIERNSHSITPPSNPIETPQSPGNEVPSESSTRIPNSSDSISSFSSTLGNGNLSSRTKKWYSIFWNLKMKPDDLQKPTTLVLPLYTPVILVLIAFVVRLLVPCQLGTHRDNLILCKYYKSFQDIPVDLQSSITIDYGGSLALNPLGTKLADAVNESNDNLSIDRVSVASEEDQVTAWSSKGINQLILKDLDVAFSSRDLTEKEKNQAKENGFELQSVAVAKDGLALFVSSEQQKIDRLTLDEIKGIYTGKIDNWSQVKSSVNEQIKLFSPDPTNNIRPFEFFQQEILKGQNFTEGITKAEDITSLMRDVDKIINGIGFASTSSVCKNQGVIKPLLIESNNILIPPCNEDSEQPNSSRIEDDTYPLTRKLFVIIRRDDDDDAEREKASIAYVSMLLSDQGQLLAKEAGFVPIRKSN